MQKRSINNNFLRITSLPKDNYFYGKIEKVIYQFKKQATENVPDFGPLNALDYFTLTEVFEQAEQPNVFFVCFQHVDNYE